MPKILKILLAGILSAGICYFSYSWYYVFKYGHSINWEMDKDYLWIFADSIKSNINTDYSCSFVKESDVYNSFHYKEYYVAIWEFREIGIKMLDDVVIDTFVNLENVKFESYETLNKHSDLEISVKYKMSLNKQITISIDKYSNIRSYIKNTKYKGFLGTVNKMSISNKDGENQVLFDYCKGPELSMVLLYKGHSCFYIIIINSKEPFDEQIIKILNLT